MMRHLIRIQLLIFWILIKILKLALVNHIDQLNFPTTTNSKPFYQDKTKTVIQRFEIKLNPSKPNIFQISDLLNIKLTCI